MDWWNEEKYKKFAGLQTLIVDAPISSPINPFYQTRGLNTQTTGQAMGMVYTVNNLSLGSQSYPAAQYITQNQ